MAGAGRNLIITGLPRSGTSLLCARVNAFSNSAIINEPPELFEATKAADMAGLGRVYAQYREDITQGKPVLNKIKDGKFIEDTRLEDSRSPHVHPVDNAGFTLGIKNTLLFLAMLNDITRLNQFSVVASIRHPLDCIASWRSVSFPHLKHAKPDFLQAYASADFKSDLQALIAEPDIDIRAALLWCLLAKTIIKSKRKLLLLRYEDMVKRPDRCVDQLAKYLGVDLPAESFEVSSPVRRRFDLEPAQVDKISATCAKLASNFGYRMN